MTGKPQRAQSSMARSVADIREYVTLEQAGLLMRAAYEMGLRKGRLMEVPPFCGPAQNGVTGGEG